MSTVPEESSRATSAGPTDQPSDTGAFAATATAPHRPSADGSSRPDRSRPDRSRQGVRALLTRLHFYAGVFVAPFLIVAALTGLAYAFAPQLDQLVYGDQLTVEKPEGTPHPLADQVAAARAAHPEGTLDSVITPADPEETTRVVLAVPELGENQRTVFVDPYTNEVKGALTTSFNSTPVTTWLGELHRNLHLGEPGRLYSETAASWLWVIVAAGLVLWLARRRSSRGHPVRRVLMPDRGARGVRRTRGWHATTGLWLAVGLFFLSATGLTWSSYAGARFETVLDKVHARTPELNTSLPSAPAGSGESAGPHGHHGGSASSKKTADPIADIGPVLATAREAGLTGTVKLTPSADEHSAWSVAQNDKVWPVHLDQVAVDADKREVTATNRWSDYPLPAKLTKLGIQAHMGVLFGLANQLLLAATAIGLLFVIAWGYRMWWQRRPTRADRSAPLGKPPVRGAWRRLPLPVLLLGLPVAATIGWAVPVLGVTLLGFLAVDIAIGRIRRYRRSRDIAASTS
ncbi:PepSY-associated TM helix domain-containing protein [Streptomyces halobius]|uniref:PepSY domain-containing protein n=1 Tax=Streptomyces halobius TaxID=2879846 RepID=A0ABY4MBR4_9ACTN|nr:PepSY domain-containing protein [Streptomyces halobius]UQA95226.1 PepSY domain-containing protein [Streptomyces halobius]